MILNNANEFTREGNSVERDTNPDLTLYKGAYKCSRTNTRETLTSDHVIIGTHLSIRGLKKQRKSIRLTNWHKFRHSEDQETHLEDLDQWVGQLQVRSDKHTTEV
ncbi:hypothetical protein HPB48_022699 [Haemaphysalis longicornis]|uniref:Uncharacterized protein n=1 Tax=Haemaphysalis longicornis TaxID=44386 RepID=A0A9J6FR90_HAELO|nr:hypothetical protein HPB48_022699 [Haemaphysalis longicornis]